MPGLGVLRTSRRLERVQQSTTVATALKVLELRRQGVDVINLAVGEPDLGTPAHICEAAQRAIAAGATRYTDLYGTRELREALVAWLEAQHGIRFALEEVMASSGAKQVLYNLFQALLDDEEEVIIPSPYWTSYPELVLMAGGKPILAPASSEDGFLPDPERIAALVTPRTRAVLLPSPTNPTGTVYSAELAAELVALCASRGIAVISDDIYRALSYEGTPPSIARLAHDAGATYVLVDGVSKAYRMTGWRIGFAAAHPDLIRAMGVIQGQSTSCPAAVSQAAATAALSGPQDCIEELRAEFARRRRVIVDRVRAVPGLLLPVEPQGAFYVFPDARAFMGARTPEGQVIDSDRALCAFLLDKAHVASNPGVAFGAPGFIRFSYATSLEAIERGMDRLGEVLATLRR